eukprot:NODE_38_length_35257_cov_0.939047.p2 type:complete len:792 gc:universal NODE_38_length_35257_cov_0.939047:15655-13280(-)
MYSISITGNLGSNVAGQFLKAYCSMYNLTSRRFIGHTLVKDLQLPLELKFVTNHPVIVIEFTSLDMCSFGFYVLNIQQSLLNYYPGTCRVLLFEPLFELEATQHELEFKVSEMSTILPISFIFSKLPELQKIKLKLESVSYNKTHALDIVKKFHKDPRHVRDLYYIIVVYQDYLYEQHYVMINLQSVFSIPENSHLFLVLESTYENLSDLDKKEFRMLLGWCALTQDQKLSHLIQIKTPFAFEAHPIFDNVDIEVKYVLSEDDVSGNSPVVRRRTIKKKPSLEPVKEALILDKNISFVENSVTNSSIEIATIPQIKRLSLEENLNSPSNILTSDQFIKTPDEPNVTENHQVEMKAVAPARGSPRRKEEILPSYHYDLRKDESGSIDNLTSVIDISNTNYDTLDFANGDFQKIAKNPDLPHSAEVIVDCPHFGLVIVNNEFKIGSGVLVFRFPFLSSNFFFSFTELSNNYDIVGTKFYNIAVEKPIMIVADHTIIKIGTKCELVPEIKSSKLLRLDSKTSDLINLNQIIDIPEVTVNDIIEAQRKQHCIEFYGPIQYMENILIPGEQASSNLPNIWQNGELTTKCNESPIYCVPIHKLQSSGSSSTFISVKPFHISTDVKNLTYNLFPKLNKVKVTCKSMSEDDILEIEGQFDDNVFYKTNVAVISKLKIHRSMFTQPIVITPILGTVTNIFIIKLLESKQVKISPSELIFHKEKEIFGTKIDLSKIIFKNHCFEQTIVSQPLRFLRIKFVMEVGKSCKTFEIKRKLYRKVLNIYLENLIYQQFKFNRLRSI